MDGLSLRGADVRLEHAGDVERVVGELEHFRAGIWSRGTNNGSRGLQEVDALRGWRVGAVVHTHEGLGDPVSEAGADDRLHQALFTVERASQRDHGVVL